MKSRTKVESNAIDIIRLIVDKSDKLLPDPTFGDKGISTDGCILLYKNSETDKAENFLREIKIQIKGRTDKTKSKTHLCQTKIKETVEVKDLENYSRFGGAVFFFVYFDKEFNDHSVYYSVLMLVKIKSYLSIAQRAHSKGVPITFDRLIEDGDTIFNICAQFYQEQKRQGFGDGQVLEHIVSWKDLKGETTLSATAVGVSNEMDFLRRIARGDIYFYTKIGDSNTYGYIPETGMRYPRDVRYPGRLQLLLGDDYAVVEEGCNGRTTIHDDPIDGWKNGRDHLKPCLNSHKQVDIVILMLGSNDLKATFHLTAEQIAEGAGELVDVIQSFTAEKQGFVPKIILVSPPEIGTGIRTSPFYGAFFEEAIAESKRFLEYYKAVADAKGCIFFNAAEHIYPSEVDSLHLTPEGHKVLAEKLSEIVKGISG